MQENEQKHTEQTNSDAHVKEFEQQEVSVVNELQQTDGESPLAPMTDITDQENSVMQTDPPPESKQSELAAPPEQEPAAPSEPEPAASSEPERVAPPEPEPAAAPATAAAVTAVAETAAVKPVSADETGAPSTSNDDEMKDDDDSLPPLDGTTCRLQMEIYLERIKGKKDFKDGVRSFAYQMTWLNEASFKNEDDRRIIIQSLIPKAARAALDGPDDCRNEIMFLTLNFIGFTKKFLLPIAEKGSDVTSDDRSIVLTYLNVLFAISECTLGKRQIYTSDFIDMVKPFVKEEDYYSFMSNPYGVLNPAQNYFLFLILAFRLDTLFDSIVANHALCSFQHYRLALMTLFNCTNCIFLNSMTGKKHLSSALYTIGVNWLSMMTDEDIRNFSKEQMDKTFAALHFCQENPFAKDTVEVLDRNFLETSLRCIRSGFIDKRVYGVRCLGTVCTWVKISQYRQDHFITEPFFAKWLSDNAVLEPIFDTSAQVEVIKESKDVVEFMLSQQDCPMSLLNIMWNSVLTLHESIADAILHVLTSCWWYLTDRVTFFFISKIEQMPDKQLTTNIIHFYEKLTDKKRFYDRALTFLSNLAIVKQVSDKVHLSIEKAILSIVAFLYNEDDRFKWIEYFVVVIVKHLAGNGVNEDKLLFAIRILKSLLKKSNDSAPNNTVRRLLLTTYRVSDTEQSRFIDIMINEVINSHKNTFDSGPVSSEDNEQIGKKDGFVPRLTFVLWLLTQSGFVIPSDLVRLMWSHLCSAFVPSHTEAFLDWAKQCCSADPFVLQNCDAIYIVNDMISFAEKGLVTKTCFTSIWNLVCSLNGVKDPSKAHLDRFICLEPFLTIMFSSPDDCVFEEGKRCISSLCPFLAEHKKAKDVLPRDAAMLKVLNNIVLRESSDLSSFEKEMSDHDGKDIQLCARKLARTLDLIDHLVTVRNDKGYNCFLNNESKSLKQGRQISVTVDFQGLQPIVIRILNNENLGTLRSMVTDRLKLFCPSVFWDDLAFLYDGSFIPRNEWSEEENRRTLKEAGIRNGSILHAVAPDDISERKTKLIVRTGANGGLNPDGDKEPAVDTKPEKPTPEAIRGLVDDLCKETSIDETFAIFLLNKFDWNATKARDTLSNSDDLQKAQLEFETDKKNKETSAASHQLEKVLLPSAFAKELSSMNQLVLELFSLLRFNNYSVAYTSWSLLQHIPLRPDAFDVLCSDSFDKTRFSLDTPFDLLYNLRAVEFVLCSSDKVDLSNRLYENGVTSFIVDTLFPELISSLSSSLKECLATCVSIVTLVSNGNRSRDDKAGVSLEQTGRVLGFIAEDSSSSSSESDSIIVSHVFELLESAARTSAETRERILEYLFASGNNEKLFKLLIEHNDKRVRHETAEGVMLLIPSESDFGAFSKNSMLCLTKLLPLTTDHCFVDPERSSHSEQFFKLIASLCNGLVSGRSDGTNEPEVVFAPVKELFMNNFKQWLEIMFDSPIVEVFSKHNDARCGDETDSFLAGIMLLLRSSLAMFPSLKGSLFGPAEVKRVLDDVLFKVTNTLQTKCLPKAKQESTRAAVFDLLAEAIKGCPQNASVVADYMSSNIPTWVDDHTENLQSIKSWSYNPSLYARGSLGFVGLHNNGNLCYMNSVMQQLYHIPQLRRAILAIDPKSLKCSEKLRAFVIEFQKLFYFMSHTEQREVNPRKFLSAFASVTDYFEETQQHDADEFLNILWQRLEEALTDSPQWKQLNSIFSGRVQHEIKSMDESKPYIQHRYEDFHVLSLEIATKSSLADALEFYIQPDKLSGDNAYFCEQYGVKLDASKHAMLEHLPPVLAVHLKRFAYSPVKGKMVKLHDKVEFPKVLSLEPYTVEDVSDQSPSRFQYRLRGVIVHSGESQSGHYYSFINTTLPHSTDPASGKRTRRWHKFNDGEVEVFSEDQLEQQCFGGTKTEVVSYGYGYQPYTKEVPKTNSAYMLFYERCDMIDDGDDDDLADTVLPESEPIVGDPAVEQPAPPAATAAAATVTGTATSTSFISLPKMMNNENTKFIHQLFLNSPTLFSFLYSLWTEGQQPCDARILTRMFLDVVCRSFAKERFVSLWANRFASLLEKDKQFAAWYLDYVMDSNIVKSHVLPGSPTELIRVKVADTIIVAMKSAAPLEKAVWSMYKDVKKCDKLARLSKLSKPTPVLNFMDHLFDLLRPCREHWQTFNQYFRLFLEFAKLGPQARFALMEADISTLFMNWFDSRKQTVEVMNKFYFPDLRDFFNTLCNVWCGCFQGRNEDSTSPYACDSVLIKPLGSFKSSLFSRDFFTSVMEHPYNPAALARMACHYCYNDADATKQILSYCICFLGRDVKDRQPAKRVVNSVLDISDDFQDARLNLFMSAYQDGTACGLLGALQMAQSRKMECICIDMEHLDHCCKSDFGFAIALAARDTLDWVDGYCVNGLRKEMRKKPNIFERLCLQGDQAVLGTQDGREFAETDSVKAFTIIRSLIKRMDELDEKQLNEYHSLLIQRRIALLQKAVEAVQNDEPYIEQPEWSRNVELVKSGRFAPPENPFHSYDAVIPEVTIIDGYNAASSVKENSNNHAPSEAEIQGMINQARDILGEVDESQFRALLKNNNYNLEQAINDLFS